MRKKKTDAAVNSKALKVSQEKLNELISQKAREIYMKKGCVPGHDLENWLEAEKLIKK